MKAACPSFACQHPGSIASACSTRTPPVPRIHSCLRRSSSPASYNRAVRSRSASSLPGRSASSRIARVRPDAHLPRAELDRPAGQLHRCQSGTVVGVESGERHAGGIEDLVTIDLPAVLVERLVEVAALIQKPHGHERNPEVRGALQVVAPPGSPGRRSRSGSSRGPRTRRRSRPPGGMRRPRAAGGTTCLRDRRAPSARSPRRRTASGTSGSCAHASSRSGSTSWRSWTGSCLPSDQRVGSISSKRRRASPIPRPGEVHRQLGEIGKGIRQRRDAVEGSVHVGAGIAESRAERWQEAGAG